MRPSIGAILLAAAALLGPPALALRALPPAEPADLVFVSGPEPESLDPAVAARVVDLRIVSALFEPLVALDPATLEPRPAAAATWTADPHGVTFRLAPGLRFSSGEPIEAQDFLRSWRRAADPATGAPMQAEARAVAEAARALDARTIRVEPANPRPDLLPLLSLPAFAPVQVSCTGAFGERWTRPEHMVSSGPYRLAAWEPGRRIRLERDPFWRDAASVALGSIEALATGGGSGEAIASLRAYETGAADLTFAVPSRAAVALRAGGREDLHERPGAGTCFLRFNCTRAPLDRPEVRRALALSVDPGSLCRDVLRGGDEPAFSLVPPGFPGYDPPGERDRGWARVEAEAEAARARTLLEGKALELLYPSSEDSAGVVGEALQDEWRRRFGLELRLRPSEMKTAFASVKRLEYDIAWGSWIADYPDAGSVLAIFRSGSGNNRTGFADGTYDMDLDAAVARTGAARSERLLLAEMRLLHESPLAPLCRTRAVALVRPGLLGAGALPFAHTMPWARLRWAGGRRPPS